MTTCTLVVSNPPHGTVDIHRAGPLLGLIPVEANLKCHYPIPEIWLAHEEAAYAQEVAELLEEASARVVVVGSEELVAVPGQRLIHGFTFGATGLGVQLRGGTVEVPYRVPVIAVHCVPQPPAGGTGAPPIQVEPGGPHVSEGSSFVDFYLRSTKGLVRLSLYAEAADFTGLGERRVPSHARNMAQFLDEVGKRFTSLHLDHRLVNMQLRRRTSVGAGAARENTRKGYSFASPGLRELLERVAPGLVDAGQSDLSSRLVYLTLRS